MTSKEANALIRQSLGLPQIEESKPTVPTEGHVCEFPLWSFSKQRSTVTQVHVTYEDGSFFTVEAPKGMPSPRFPGYLDVIMFYGQRDLFLQEHVEISVYTILKTLGLDPNDGRSYDHFRRDMLRLWQLYVVTDRIRDPRTGERPFGDAYFRVLRRMFLARHHKGTSTFHFDDFFIASLRTGYLKRLDWEYCLELDRQGEALVRFLYGHLTKRIGEKSLYMRKLPGFLSDIGFSYLLKGEPKRINEMLKRTVYPALDRVRGITYWVDDSGTLVFTSTYSSP
jgi:hypothetical protein